MLSLYSVRNIIITITLPAVIPNVSWRYFPSGRKFEEQVNRHELIVVLVIYREIHRYKPRRLVQPALEITTFFDAIWMPILIGLLRFIRHSKDLNGIFKMVQNSLKSLSIDIHNASKTFME